MAVQLPHDWKARHYQQDFMGHMFAGGHFPHEKRAFPVWHRRAGKDSCFLQMLAVASQMQVGTYWHLLPTLNQGRKVVWNGIDGMGRRMVNQAFPYELQDSSNENEMTLKLKNGSIYQVVGSDNYDALVGTNPLGVGFSEWALSDPRAWNFVRPILAENGGFAAFNTTPRGRNHAYDLYTAAQKSPNWFTSRYTVRDTFREDGRPVISEAMIQMERDEGVSEEIIQQEYYCSWEGINQGSIYGRLLNKFAETNQLVFSQPYDPDLPVYTAWDIGRRDATAVWFYQRVGDEIHIVDYSEWTGLGVDEVLPELIRDFPYAYGVAALPHDAKAKTFATKYTTQEQFVSAGLKTYIVKNISRAQGIDAFRALIPSMYFNIGNKNVQKGLERLMAYMYEWDEKRKVFTREPLHDDASHGSDAGRMLALSYSIVAGITKRTNTTKLRGVQTRLGPALMLDSLFADREASRQQYRRV